MTEFFNGIRLFPTLAIAAAMLGAFPVAAQATSPSAAPALAAFDWTGLYFGGSAGLVSSNSAIHEPYYNDHFSASGFGAIGGVDVGYNYQRQALVIGVEADITGASARGNILEYENYYAAKSQLGGLGTVRARFGYAIDRALVYATGGFAYGDVSDRSGWPPDGAGYDTSANAWKAGWTLGGGLEYALTSNWTARAEGLYVSLAKQVNTDRYGYGNAFANTAAIVRLGLNYQFESTKTAPPPPAPVEDAVDWTGFYVGGSVGLVSSKSAIDEPYYGDHFSAAGFGAIGGVDVGYNYQMQALVIGAEADVAAASAGGNILESDNYYAAKSRLDGLGTVRARLGYALDRALIYTTGGLAFGDVSDRSGWLTSSAYNTSANVWKTGWALGGGLEYALTSNWTLRAEGLYVSLAKQVNDDYRGYGNAFSQTAELGRLGLNYKF